MLKFKKMKDIRKDAGITQEELSNILRIKKDTYSKYESGGAIPSMEIVFNFSKYFGYRIDFVLLEGSKRESVSFHGVSYNKQLIAKNLKYLRLSEKLSQDDLASKLGVTQSAIHRYENGLSNPSIKVLNCYRKSFGFSFHDVCTTDLSKK